MSLDGDETGILLSDFAQRLHRDSADVLDIYFTLLDAASLSPTLTLAQNAKSIGKGSWISIKSWTSEAAKA